jgi:hypothetical protein
MTTDEADRAAYAADVACRDGQLERAAHLLATAMGTDPDRAGLWKSAASQLIARAGQAGLRRQVTLRLLAAGIDATIPDCSRQPGTTRHPESECQRGKRPTWIAI